MPKPAASLRNDPTSGGADIEEKFKYLTDFIIAQMFLLRDFSQETFKFPGRYIC